MKTSGTELRFSPEALLDIEGIQQYRFEVFGLDQVERYESLLYEGFVRLRQHPDIGERTHGAMREFVVRNHVVISSYEANAVTMLRVMHPRWLRER